MGMFEVWKNVPDLDGLFQVSSLGRVKSLQRNCILEGYLINSGYLSVYLSNGKQKGKGWLIHRLVCTVFTPNPENKRFVNHKNGNKLDNALENLEWCTRSENELHAYKTGLKAVSEKQLIRLRKFNTETKSLPLAQFTKKGKLVNTYPSGVDAAQKTGFDYSSIMACAKGTYRNHRTCGGFIWIRVLLWRLHWVQTNDLPIFTQATCFAGHWVQSPNLLFGR